MMTPYMLSLRRAHAVRGLLLAILLATSLLAAIPTPAAAQEWEDAIASLVVDRGTVEVYNAEGELVEELAELDVTLVSAGQKVRVSEDGEATITFFEGAESRLGPGSELVLDVFRTSGESTDVQMSVMFGQTLHSVENALDAESRHEVHTPTATISVRGTEYLVSVREGELTQTATIDGEVNMTVGERSEVVLCGYGLKHAPGEELGTPKVWGNTFTQLQAPVEDIPTYRVVITDQESGTEWIYRSSDPVMTVPLGTFDLVVESPGPARVRNVTFDENFQPEDVLPLVVPLAAVTVDLVDEDGNPVVGDMVVRLQQDDLVNTATIAAGTTVLVGEGVWDVEVSQPGLPEQVQRFKTNAVSEIPVTLPVPANGFGG